MFVRDFVELKLPVEEVLHRLDERAVERAAAEAGALAWSLLGRRPKRDSELQHTVALGPCELRLGVWNRSFSWHCAGIEELFTDVEGDLTVIPVADRRSELLLTATSRPNRRVAPTALRSNAITDIAVRRFLSVLGNDGTHPSAPAMSGASGPYVGPLPLLMGTPPVHDADGG
ncbi:MAG: hypothetical protein AB7L13_07625 [Acidimicrobiia bacterium]